MIISSIIPVVIVSILVQGLLYNRLVEVQKSNLVNAAEFNRSGLEALVEAHKTEINMLTHDSTLVSLLNESNSTDSALIHNANQILQKRKDLNPYCMVLTLYDEDRLAIASTDMYNIDADCSFNLTLSYIYATKKPAVGISGSSNSTIEIAYPILASDSNDPPLGYILSSLHLSYFDEYLDAIAFGDTGHALLLDHNGDVLYHPDDSLMGTTVTSTKLSSIVEDYNKGLIDSIGTFKLYYNGTNQIYGYSIIPELDWTLLVKQDVSEISSMTFIILAILVFICGVILFFTILFANALSRRYTEPIIELRDAMRTASNGDLTVQSNIKRKNELGELSKNFNKMLHIIKTNYEDLESMHEELLANEEQLRSNYDHIEYLAYHDTLTNLPNKLAFLDYVNAALISSPGSNKSHAVYFIDLDNFKTVNDTLGHEYGDSLLLHTAMILTTLGENTMLARAGGDEFLVFKEDISSQDEALDYASSIIGRFRYPIEINGEDIYLSMSIGIAIYPDNGLSPNALIKNADIAMYKSKDTGKSKYTLFDSKMEEELNRNTTIVDILRNAIENKDIYLQYQPQYELATKSIIGFEALMRIRSDLLGFITPEEFIPIAEESGLIIELSAWLIKEACIFNKKLIDYGISPRYVSVNISSVQINRPGFIDFLSNILDETGLPPEYLVLEITESTLVSSIMDATELLHNLQRLGVRISLDDFGTGYSSLNYLTRMPINTLKIDKSFVDNITISKKDARIAESIIALAHSLKIKVVAEGVETEEQLALLKEQNCDIIQGFIFASPLYPEELEDLIKHK